MFQKLKPYKLVILFFTLFLFIVLGKNAYAASTSCGGGVTNIPQHMAVSCNNTILPTFSVPVVRSGPLTVTGSAKLDVGFPNGIPLFQFLDSVSSIGTKDSSNSSYNNPYQPYGYFTEKTNINPNVNFSTSSSLNGIGAINVPPGCSAPSGGSCSILSTSGAYSYFSVPGIGKAVDLFTLGNIFTISGSPYTQSLSNLSTPFISSTPQNPVGSCSGSANGCVNGQTPLAYKLTTPYGNNPYNVPSNSPTSTLLYWSTNFYQFLQSFLSDAACTLINAGCPISGSSNIQSAGYCSKYITQVNRTATETANLNPPYCPVSGMTINVSYTCPQSLTPQECQTQLGDFLANGIQVNLDPSMNLYLQGLNRILADEWYAEASLDGGPAIGHTNLYAWDAYVNPNTYKLHAWVQQILNQGPTNPLYNTIINGTPRYNNPSPLHPKCSQFSTSWCPPLFTGIGENVYTQISLTSLNTGATTSITPTNFYFPWIGEALQIQQNLAIHNFQPYFNNGGNLPALAQGEYYIQNQSKYPDPLLLYLLYVGALSPTDPVVQNALGSYPVSNILSSSPTSPVGNPVSLGGWNQTQLGVFPFPKSIFLDKYDIFNPKFWYQCTWWAYYNDPLPPVTGNAYQWPSEVMSYNKTAPQNKKIAVIPASYGPMVGDIVVFGPGGGYSSFGHLAVVIKVNRDSSGKITSYDVSQADVPDLTTPVSPICGSNISPNITCGTYAQIPWPDSHVMNFLPPQGEWYLPVSAFQQPGV
ncbi:MAG: CHAP domain-containing protein [Patescibacteria group bacterium]